jgi:S-adenosylmethionine/arginine decarboxylase-like enzyme
MVNKTRKIKKDIQHHHLLLRIETRVCPEEKDKILMADMIHQLVKDISMKPLGKQEVFYVREPKNNEGLTAIQVIETSHIAFHFWKHPEKNILRSKKSNCLLQMDVYTCSELNNKQISILLNELGRFEPTHANVTLLNRKWSLSIDKQDRYDSTKNNCSWAEWVMDRF